MISLKRSAAAFLALAAVLIAPARCALFIAAHPDDVPLMMHKNAATDVATGYPTVFVLTTAGDAANGTGYANNTMRIPYYRARLRAFESIVHFWQGLNPDVPAPVPQRTTELIAGKAIETVHMGNVVMYHLNLPDDMSLQQLATGRLGMVTSLNPVNTYTLAELKEVIREIVRINNRAAAMVNLNTQDPDTRWNPGDHTDHVATGMIVNAAITESPQMRCVNLLFYRGYVIQNFAPTYTLEETRLHQATLGALNAALVANGNRSTWDAFHNNFVGRMDFRGVPGAGYCNF